MNDTEKETLTAEDMNRVFIRAQEDDTAHWKSISVQEASNLQFDTWAKTRMEIQGEPGPWGMSERASFCDMLYQAGALHILKKDFEESERE